MALVAQLELALKAALVAWLEPSVRGGRATPWSLSFPGAAAGLEAVVEAVEKRVKNSRAVVVVVGRRGSEAVTSLEKVTAVGR